jgi:hypothetical protein
MEQVTTEQAITDILNLNREMYKNMLQNIEKQVNQIYVNMKTLLEIKDVVG